MGLLATAQLLPSSQVRPSACHSLERPTPFSTPETFFVEDGFHFNYPPIGRRAVSPRIGRALARAFPTTDRTSSLTNLAGSRS